MPTTDELAEEIEALKNALQELTARDRGTIILGAMATPPPGTLACDGTVYDITQDANARLKPLFEKIGNLYPGGDGVTTFAVPELRGETLKCWDNGRGVDPGRTLGSFQDWSTAMPRAIFQTLSTGQHDHGGNTSDESQKHRHPASADGQTKQGGPNTFDSGTSRGVNFTATVTVGPNDQGHTHAITQDGYHSHSIIGGDAETRSRNVALAAYIRF